MKKKIEKRDAIIVFILALIGYVVLLISNDLVVFILALIGYVVLLISNDLV